MSLYDKFLNIITNEVNDLNKLSKANDFIIKIRNLDKIFKKIQIGNLNFDLNHFTEQFNKYINISKDKLNKEQIDILEKNYFDFKNNYNEFINKNEKEIKINLKKNDENIILNDSDSLYNSILEMKNIASTYTTSLEEDSHLLIEVNEIQNQNIKSIDENLGKLINFEKMSQSLSIFQLLKLFLISIILFFSCISLIIFDRHIFSWLN